MEELSLEEVINKNGYIIYPFKGVSKDELRITYPNIDKYVIFFPVYEIRRCFLRMRKGRTKVTLKEVKEYNATKNKIIKII